MAAAMLPTGLKCAQAADLPSMEMGQPYDEEASLEKVARIYDTVERVIYQARTSGITTAQAADRLAEERIAAMRRVKGIYL